MRAVPRPPAEWHFTQPIPLGSKKISSPFVGSPACDKANARKSSDVVRSVLVETLGAG